LALGQSLLDFPLSELGPRDDRRLLGRRDGEAALCRAGKAGTKPLGGGGARRLEGFG
jgi:hypothetical protein